MKKKTEVRKICKGATAIIQKEIERAEIRIVVMEIKRVNRFKIQLQGRISKLY